MTDPQTERVLRWLERKTFEWMAEAHDDPSTLDAEEHVVEDAHELVTRLHEVAENEQEIDETAARDVLQMLSNDD